MNNAEQFRTGLSLKSKFLIWLLVFTLIIMSLVYGFFINHERRALSREVILRGEAICKNLATGAEDLLVMKDDLGLAKIVYDTKNQNPGVIDCFVLDNQMQIWAHTDIMLVNNIYKYPPGLKKLGNNKILTQDLKLPDQTIAYEISVPIEVRQNRIGEAHITLSKETVTKAVREARQGATVVTAIILAVGITSILILVSFIIGSLDRVTDDIEAIGDGDLDRQIATERRDEIGRIAHAVKTMALKLKKAQQELVEKERMKREMQIAQEIQRSLLPMVKPEITGYMIDSYYHAAMEVGGDYYDYFSIDKNIIGLVIADVSGKGIAGSLVMTMLRSLIRSEASKSTSPKDTLVNLNAKLSRDIPENMYVTLYYLVLDAETNDLAFSCAGHNPAYLYTPINKKLTPLKPQGPPLGTTLFDQHIFETRLKEEKRMLQPGDTVLLYTDGITEAMNKNKEQFGVERLEKIIIQNHLLKPDKLKDLIKAEVEKFTGNIPQSDDIALLILQKQ